VPAPLCRSSRLCRALGKAAALGRGPPCLSGSDGMIGMAWPLMRAALHAMDAERAHDLTLAALETVPMPDPPADDPRLAVEAFGLRFANPVGLAAGFDKDARVADQMLKLGFGYVETGSITPRPQAGNPKPRVFRLSEEEGVINRLGFNNGGHAAALV